MEDSSNNSSQFESKLCRTKRFLRKHGYLKLKCIACGKEFTCSGHCLKKVTSNVTLSKDGCLCANCDEAKKTDLRWFNRCQKDFPYSWILKAGKPKCPKSQTKE